MVEKLKFLFGGFITTSPKCCVHNRLLENKEHLLDFAFVEGIPFSNNEAERALRPAKIKLKVATSFRTQQGADDYATIQSFISTLRRQKMNV